MKQAELESPGKFDKKDAKLFLDMCGLHNLETSLASLQRKLLMEGGSSNSRMVCNLCVDVSFTAWITFPSRLCKSALEPFARISQLDQNTEFWPFIIDPIT